MTSFEKTALSMKPKPTPLGVGCYHDALQVKQEQARAEQEPLTRAKLKQVAKSQPAEVSNSRPEPLYPALPNKTYDIIYADPPWDYKGHKQHNKTTDTGGAETHYPTLTLTELKALDVQSISNKNALLFLWTTGSHLDQSIERGQAWGFNYTTMAFVWDKDKAREWVGNVGYYTMNPFECVLVFKRGKRPDNRGKTPSSRILEKRQAHSKKPDAVRSAIFSMYPTAKRIELFARQETPAWDVWGNEATRPHR